MTFTIRRNEGQGHVHPDNEDGYRPCSSPMQQIGNLVCDTFQLEPDPEQDKKDHAPIHPLAWLVHASTQFPPPAGAVLRDMPMRGALPPGDLSRNYVSCKPSCKPTFPIPPRLTIPRLGETARKYQVFSQHAIAAKGTILLGISPRSVLNRQKHLLPPSTFRLLSTISDVPRPPSHLRCSQRSLTLPAHLSSLGPPCADSVILSGHKLQASLP